MIKKDELELIEFKLDDESDISVVSIVTDPAIQKSFQLFKSVGKDVFVSAIDKQEITGPAMVPDMPILRVDDSGKYYNCFFSEQTVRDCASLYLRNCNHIEANFEHSDIFTKDIFVIESWIVEDPEKDKSKALGFSNITKGTWMITYKVANTELWSKIKVSGFTGFSIEGIFDRYEAIRNEDIKLKKIYSIVNSKLNDSDKERLIKTIIYTK